MILAPLARWCRRASLYHLPEFTLEITLDDPDAMLRRQVLPPIKVRARSRDESLDLTFDALTKSRKHRAVCASIVGTSPRQEPRRRWAGQPFGAPAPKPGPEASIPGDTHKPVMRHLKIWPRYEFEMVVHTSTREPSLFERLLSVLARGMLRAGWWIDDILAPAPRARVWSLGRVPFVWLVGSVVVARIVAGLFGSEVDPFVSPLGFSAMLLLAYAIALVGNLPSLWGKS